MGKLLDLAIYNPSRLSDENFLMSFVARQRVTERILDRMRQIKPDSLAQHRLIVGQRGMGKTSLLRRLAIEVQRDPALSSVLLPLTFREEQYNIHSLHVLWCNCLDSLGDYFEASQQFEKAVELDRDVAGLERIGVRDGHAAFELFRSWFKREGRRPLLLIDNLDIVFGLLSKDDEWSLRRVLQEAGGLVVVGASTSALEAAVNPSAAFYEFFQVDILERLELEEVKTCLSQLASRRGEAGKGVQELLTKDPARVQVLHDLTGGNPRTLTMLYLVLEATEDESVMVDLERLLDQATPLYKARVEELALQARVVFDAVALSWDPVTAANLAAISTLEINTVSAQLDRLVRDGVVEKVSLSTSRRTGFQVAERFFNIWYLMRHGPRRQRQRLKWLAESLRRIYTRNELEDRARLFLETSVLKPIFNLAFCLAIGEALDEGPLKASLLELAFEADPKLRRETSDARRLPSSSHVAEQEVTDYRQQIEETPGDALAWFNFGNSLGADRLNDAAAAFRQATILDPEHSEARHELIKALIRLRQFDEVADVCRAATEAFPDSAPAWNNLGSSLQTCEQFAEAEAAFRRAIEIDPSNSLYCIGLGNSLRLLGRFDEAAASYQRSIEHDPRFEFGFLELADLQVALGRLDEAQGILQQSIELYPNSAAAWTALGNLKSSLGQHEEATAALQRSTGLDPNSARAWLALGHSLRQLERLSEAEASYRRSLELEPSNEYSWLSLGYLLRQMRQWKNSADTLRSTARLESIPKVQKVSALYSLGNLLADQLDEPEEAEKVFLQALSIDPQSLPSLCNLSYLLIGQGRLSEAEEYYRHAVADLPPAGAQLLRAFRLLADSDLEKALGELEPALQEDHPDLFTTFRDDLLRFLRFAAARGWGDRVLEFLENSGLNERFRPLFVAFDGYLHGEARLRDVNPEVRSGAAKLLAEMGTIPGPIGEKSLESTRTKNRRRKGV